MSFVLNLMSLPLAQRCAQLETFINKAPLKEVSNELPTILESMFGFGLLDEGWKLDEITKSYSSYTFDILRTFLSPSGVLFKSLHTLQQDPHILFDFPISCLPMNTQHAIEDGTMTLYLANRLHLGTSGRPVLLLDAFELYMFHFAYYLVDPNHRRSSTPWHNLQESLYPVLLEDYMSHYLPLTPKTTLLSSPMHSTPHLSRHSPLHHSPTVSPVPNGSLLRHSVIANREQMTQSVIGHDLQNSELSQSDTVIEVFCEFWLGQVPSPSLLPTHLSSSAFDTCIPSNNLVLALRSFIKYLHYFTNSAEPEAIVSVYHQPTINPWDEFKRKCVSQIMQKRLYKFLRHCFDRWPLDSSFRLVLETWLSYIQIWRYVDLHEHSHDSENKIIMDKWLPFITENLLFYTVLFREFLQRLERVDLTSPFHAYMLFRCTKVFSQKNLKNILDKAETSVSESRGHNLSDIGASYLSSQQSIAASLASQIHELEAPGFLYQPMFSGATVRQVDEIIRQAFDAHHKMLANHKQSGHSGGWFSWLFNSDSAFNYGDITRSELNKLEQHLDASTHLLCSFFELPLNVYRTDALNQTLDHVNDSTMLNESTIASSNSPHCTTVNGCLQLSDVGRHQVINGVRKFDSIFRGDPDLLPIRGHENATLVRLLYQLSQFVNHKCGDKIDSLYKCNNFIGRMTQVFFAPALAPNSSTMTPMSPEQKVKFSRPRLSLRPLASYQKIVTFIFVYFLIRTVFGVGFVGFLFLSFIMLVIYVMLKAMLKSFDRKLD